MKNKKQDLSIIWTLPELDQDDPAGGAQEGGDKVGCHLKTFIGRIEFGNMFFGCEDLKLASHYRSTMKNPQIDIYIAVLVWGSKPVG